MIDPRLFEALIGIGLGPDAARTYALLGELGATDLATLRSALHISRNRTQAALHELERKGFVVALGGASPRYARNEDPNILELLDRTLSGPRGPSPLRGVPDGVPDGLGRT